MTPRTPALVAALAAWALGSAHAQTCTEPHYRWSEKVDTSFPTHPPAAVDVSDILTWMPRNITLKDKCAHRIGRERNVYVVNAFVRRIKLHESDGDWQLEVTEEEYTDVPKNCIIVEIPAPAYGNIYRQARDHLAALVDTTHLATNGDLDTPVQVTFTGAAFFDGSHQKKTPTGKHASQHGRCNSSLSALWELHPIYDVKAPVGP